MLSPDITIVFTTIAAAVVGFVTEWVRDDLVAIPVLLTMAQDFGQANGQ